jgi:hypothetical protein
VIRLHIEILIIEEEEVFEDDDKSSEPYSELQNRLL